MATYEFFTWDNGARVTFYTRDADLARKVVLHLGDDGLIEAASYPEVVGEVWRIVMPGTERDALEAALVTWNAVETVHDYPNMIEANLEHQDATEGDAAGWQPLDEAMRRHPAGKGEPYLGLVRADGTIAGEVERTFEPCYPCKVNTRLALAASLGSFAAACVALAAVLVAA